MANEYGLEAGRKRDLETIFSGVTVIARQVEETWLATDYPEAVRSNFAQFRHAHMHAVKALGKIAAVIDHEEHERVDREATEAAAELPKLMADLIRCTAKMAEAMGINLAKAYVERAEQLAVRWGHLTPTKGDVRRKPVKEGR